MDSLRVLPLDAPKKCWGTHTYPRNQMKLENPHEGKSEYFGKRRRWASLLVAALAWIAAAQATAATTSFGSTTNLQSDADRMISYRHQDHMWQTADGAVHLMINGGGLSVGGSLTLQTSLDNGLSWTQALVLPTTDANSTSDGALVGDDLWLTYNSSSGAILFSVLHYDSVTKAWTADPAETVFGVAGLDSLNPAVAVDASGAAWCGFVTRNKSTGNAAIRMLRRSADGSGWSDTGLVFGPIDNAVLVERSARPVPLPNGIGMVFTVHENTYWAYRRNDWPLNQAWPRKTLFTSQPPLNLDPYASHFSITADANQNLHLVFPDHGKVMYMRYLRARQTWSAARTLTGNIAANYVQVSTLPATGTVAIFSNDLLGYVRVFQSQDGGTTFALSDLLAHEPPQPGSGINYFYPRIETPGRATGPVPLVQQYIDGALQKLLHFNVADSANAP